MFHFCCLQPSLSDTDDDKCRYRSAALQSRAKGLFTWLCKSSDVQRLGREDIAKLLDALGLPRLAGKNAL